MSIKRVHQYNMYVAEDEKDGARVCIEQGWHPEEMSAVFLSPDQIDYFIKQLLEMKKECEEC